MSRDLRWYVRRLSRMSPAEMATRGADQMRQNGWARLQVPVGGERGVDLPHGLRLQRPGPVPLPADAREAVPADVASALVASADALLAGDWDLLGTPRPDIADPDWFLDPGTGRRAPQHPLAFRIDHRDEDVTGNVKVVWELSRHHHLTVLAAAWWLDGDDRYAETVARQLESWWAENPFLSGIHWTSGIELAVRLTSWAWIRRLLDDWPGAAALFERNEDAVRQIWWHQAYLDGFRSRGSSGNNHAVAEAAGRLVAACAFPWFAETARWRTDAARDLERTLRRNTFPSGINRELATDYHRFVTELGLVAAVEAAAAGVPLGEASWQLLTRSLDAAAALLDRAGRPPRQGDGDEGRALVVDPPATDPWAGLLSLGAATVGAQPWWPDSPATVLAATAGRLVPARPAALSRPDVAQREFVDAGLTLLRTRPDDGAEIWCRCDGGPHGFLSIAAHAHADALSVEVRYDGVDVLCDPGTYCYHGETQWRSFFRSTRAHNTIEIDGESQSIEGGPFLWTTRAASTVLRSRVGDDLPVQTWTARHTGYSRLGQGVRHLRTVSLDRRTRRLDLTDVLTGHGRHELRLHLHLGPAVTVDLSGARAMLSWPGSDAATRLVLPRELSWTAHRGEESPPLGWYSPAFGERIPTTTLVGTGSFSGALELRTVLAFPAGGPRPAAVPLSRVRGASDG